MLKASLRAFGLVSLRAPGPVSPRAPGPVCLVKALFELYP